jgi:curved DNA-binding protein CbpA
MLKYSFRSFRPTYFKFNFKLISEKIKIKKDYYKILGIPKSASEVDIKQAYRNLAKRYHPDVNIGIEKHEPNVEKFRDIAEAYAILSNKTMRLDYDMRMKTNPNIIYNAEKMKNMEENQQNRDVQANQVKPGPMKGSYAEYRLEKLKELRKQHDVDNHGFYKGGVPKQGRGAVRGNAWAQPGAFHEPWGHNERMHDLPHVRPHVSVKEAVEHKTYMNGKNFV